MQALDTAVAVDSPEARLARRTAAAPDEARDGELGRYTFRHQPWPGR